MAMLSPQITLAQLAAQRPGSLRLLRVFEIDFRADDHRTLEEVCLGQGLAVQAVVAALLAPEELKSADLQALSLTELCDHIVGTHHTHLEAELPRLVALSREVSLRHGDAHPWLRELNTVFLDLADGLQTHVLKEEVMLFPAIRHLEAGRAAQAPFGSHLQAPLEWLEREHESIRAALAWLRDLSNGFVAPPDACSSFRALLDGLARLELETQQHIGQEDHLLFPRARAQFGPVGV